MIWPTNQVPAQRRGSFLISAAAVCARRSPSSWSLSSSTSNSASFPGSFSSLCSHFSTRFIQSANYTFASSGNRAPNSLLLTCSNFRFGSSVVSSSSGRPQVYKAAYLFNSSQFRRCFRSPLDFRMSLDQQYLEIETPKYEFSSRRSVVHSTKGIVSCTQPMAAQAGLKILRMGGNAVDAAVATAAALTVIEPTMVSPAGDVFSLFYNAKDKTLKGLNGSGRAPKELSIEYLKSKGFEGLKLPPNSVHCVTVPGGPAAWVDAIEKWGSGKITIADALAPAIEFAEHGVVIPEISASLWYRGSLIISGASPETCKDLLLPDGTPPKQGSLWVNKKLAETYKLIAKNGKAGFYEGVVAQRIVDTVQARGGVLSLDDLKSHTSTFVDPIKVDFLDGLTLWECPPNGQGILAQLAAGIIRELIEDKAVPPPSEWTLNSAPYLHMVIEALKMAFRDGETYVADPERAKVPASALLEKSYLKSRAKEFDAKKANPQYAPGEPRTANNSDTVYLAVTDSEGNACSFINSVAGMFGTGIIPPDSGFPLLNRGVNFVLDPTALNALEGGKRPYHTIIPAMLTKNGEIYAAYGVMGGFMQPQGHLQVLINHSVFNLDEQKSLDVPRICITPGKVVDGVTLTNVNVEAEISDEVVEELKAMGHEITRQKRYDPLFGRGQFIKLTKLENGITVHSAGSDPRGDGASFPFFD
ncbi:nucleophile aminohydrolase [Lipomyces oligophaga]|uniref:nucleophile aminohydrolase n=1 Tax=Lipomyces oligophaga TaxID=45792 RepID=UPI0034CEEE1B